MLQVLENKVLRKVLEPKRDKVSDKLEPYVPKSFMSYTGRLIKSTSVGV
jgi:hypothetical protein